MSVRLLRPMSESSAVASRELLRQATGSAFAIFPDQQTKLTRGLFNMEAAWQRLSDGSLSGQRSSSSPSSSWPLFWHSSGDRRLTSWVTEGGS